MKYLLLDIERDRNVIEGVIHDKIQMLTKLKQDQPQLPQYIYRDFNAPNSNLNSIEIQYDIINQYLKQQQQDYSQHQRMNRQLLIKHRKKQHLRKLQSMSHGNATQGEEFKRAVRKIEFFQQELPTLKPNCDITLNTFDNSKRFLKEFAISQKERVERGKQLRTSNYRHYQGVPWTYCKQEGQFLGDFLIYEQSPEQYLNKKEFYATKGKYFVPSSTKSRSFHTPEGDISQIIIPDKPIHTVRYLNPRNRNNSHGSKLGEVVSAKPFVPSSRYGDLFQKPKTLSTTPTKTSKTNQYFTDETQNLTTLYTMNPRGNDTGNLILMGTLN